MTKAQKHLIVALDNADLEEVLRVARLLKGKVAALKLGLEFFSKNGSVGVAAVQRVGVPIFLDLKFYDIPNTVAKAVGEVVKLNVDMLTIHTSGGEEMMIRANEAAMEQAQKFSYKMPLILGVTILTSFDAEGIKKIGIENSIDNQVVKLARLAEKSKLGGIVCSPYEVELIRKNNLNLKIITPGIRFSDDCNDDQKRVMTPKMAVQKGSDFVVMGRSILKGDILAKIEKFDENFS